MAGTSRTSSLTSAVFQPANRLVLLSLVQILFQSAFALLTARWLGPSDRGVLTIGASLASISLLIGSLGFFLGARVALAAPERGLTWRGFQQITLALSALHTALTCVVFVPAFVWLARESDLDTILAFIAYSVSMFAAGLYREGLHGLGKHSRATLTDVAMATVQVGLALGLYTFSTVSVSRLLVCGIISFTAQVVLCRVIARGEPRQPGTWKDFQDLFMTVIAFSLPGLVMATGQALVHRGDRLILGALSDPREVGIYGVAATISDAAWIVPTAVSVIVLREVASTRSMVPLRKWRPRILFASTLSALIIAAASSTAIRLLLGDDYADSTRLVWLLCGASVLFASQQVDMSACNGSGRLAASGVITLVGLATLVVGALALIPFLDATGAALASMLSYAVMAVLARRMAKRIERELATADAS